MLPTSKPSQGSPLSCASRYTELLVVHVTVDAEPRPVVAPALIDAEALGQDGGALGFRGGDAELDLAIPRS